MKLMQKHHRKRGFKNEKQNGLEMTTRMINTKSDQKLKQPGTRNNTFNTEPNIKEQQDN